jgi:hypothetical protein
MSAETCNNIGIGLRYSWSDTAKTAIGEIVNEPDLSTTAGKIADLRNRYHQAVKASGDAAIEKQHAKESSCWLIKVLSLKWTSLSATDQMPSVWIPTVHMATP